MFSMVCDIVDTVVDTLSSVSRLVGIDLLFAIGLGMEVLFVLFFLIKSSVSYEASLNRSLDKINYWLFEKKNVTEDNIRELNLLFKNKAPKRLCYHWQQYILFREGNPSSYLSVDNLIEKPMKTSTYTSNIKNLSLISTVWAFIAALFVMLNLATGNTFSAEVIGPAVLIALAISLIGLIFVLVLRARRNSTLNALYQNVSLFDRFMDNSCTDLPSYIDYQILFTPQEIEKGQPVLREFLDYKARKEKEEFNKAKDEHIDYVVYDFSETGVDGSIVLDRAMRESEKFLKKQEKINVQISQLEAELDSRRKNFDNVQKEAQTKIQASKENIVNLRKMQEETTNRIESNYYRKQQTQEAAKQEQLEQEFEQQRAKYLLEKNECEEEIKKLQAELAQYKAGTEEAMLAEYKTFFNKFCKSTEKVVGKAFGEKLDALKAENERNKEIITELEIKLKNVPQGAYDVADGRNVAVEDYSMPQEQTVQTDVNDIPPEGRYDEAGNYLYPNGSYYDVNGLFHDENGNVYSQNGELISQVQPETSVETEDQPKEEKIVVNFDDFDTFDFMDDVSQKDDVYGVAENIMHGLDSDNEFEFVNGKTEEENTETTVQAEENDVVFEIFSFDEEAQEQEETKTEQPEVVETENVEEEESSEEDETTEEVVEVAQKRKAGRPRKVVVESTQPKRKAGRPRKVVVESTQPKRKAGRPRKVVVESTQPKRKAGRPRKVVTAAVTPVVSKKGPGRPKKIVGTASPATKKPVGRPKKIVKPADSYVGQKRGRGRPKKEGNSISEINKRLSEEEAKLAAMRASLNRELELAMNNVDNAKKVDSAKARRNAIMREIDNLQSEAQKAMGNQQSGNNIEELNDKLEKLLEEIKRLG